MYSKVRYLLGFVSLVCVTATQAEIIDVAPDKIVAYLASQKSTVVQFTSPDKGCRPCLAAYKGFEQFAEQNADKTHFVRVEWKPYHNFPLDVRKKYRLLMVPAQMCFHRDEKVAAVMGPIDKLSKRKLKQFEADCF